MKKLLGVLLIACLFAGVSFGQEIKQLGSNDWAINYYLVKTYTDFVASDGDTTGFLVVPIVGSPLLGSELQLIFHAEDSINATVQLFGYNRSLNDTEILDKADVAQLEYLGDTGAYDLYYVWDIKSPGTNLLPGCTDFKLGVVHDSDSNGVTSSDLRVYMKWVK